LVLNVLPLLNFGQEKTFLGGISLPPSREKFLAWGAQSWTETGRKSRALCRLRLQDGRFFLRDSEIASHTDYHRRNISCLARPHYKGDMSAVTEVNICCENAAYQGFATGGPTLQGQPQKRGGMFPLIGPCGKVLVWVGAGLFSRERAGPGAFPFIGCSSVCPAALRKMH